MRKPISLFLCISRSRKSTSPAKRRRWIGEPRLVQRLIAGVLGATLAITLACSKDLPVQQQSVSHAKRSAADISYLPQDIFGPSAIPGATALQPVDLRSLSDSAMKYGIAPKRSSAVEYQSDVIVMEPYTYMWDKVIAEDFFAQFGKQNPLAGDVPLQYRHQVLEPGGSMPAPDLVRTFLGRPQNMKAFERWMGEEFQPVESASRK